MIQYRLIHYVPDRVQGARFPIAAAVSLRGHVVVVEADHLPGAACLGGSRRAAAMSMVCQSLQRLESFDRLPDSTGPHAVLDDVREVPAEVDNVEEWVRLHVLPQKTQEREHEGSVLPQRSTYGDKFFERWGVRPHIRKNFQPRSDLGGRLASRGATLEPVTHWVQGREGVYFMEPVLPFKKSAEEVVKHVGQRFWGYKGAIDSLGKDLFQFEPTFIAYILPGGSAKMREYAMASLREPCHLVVDADSDANAFGFAERIRKFALTASAQGELGG